MVVGKVYSEKEAAEILQRAVALQESTPDGSVSSYAPGITDEELRRIAQESGLDPKFLEMAIAEGQRLPAAKKNFFDYYRDHEIVIDGELPLDKFDVILEEVGPSSSRSMGLSQVGRMIEGQFSHKAGFGRLKVSSRQGRTRVNVRSASFIPFMLFMHPGLMGFAGGIVALALGQTILGLALGLGAPLLGFLGMRMLQKKAHADVANLVERIVQRITEEVVPVEPVETVRATVDEPTFVQHVE